MNFNVYLKKGQLAPWYLVDYEQNVIAPRAMGKFEDLLVATAKSPAMLFYLDNHTSIGPHSMARTFVSMLMPALAAQTCACPGMGCTAWPAVMEMSEAPGRFR